MWLFNVDCSGGWLPYRNGSGAGLNPLITDSGARMKPRRGGTVAWLSPNIGGSWGKQDYTEQLNTDASSMRF